MGHRPRLVGGDERGCGLYAECARRSELIQAGGAAVDIEALLRAALDRFGRPDRIVADRGREAELRDVLKSVGRTGCSAIAARPRLQGQRRRGTGLPAGLSRGPGDAGADAVAVGPLRHERGAHHGRSRRQREAGEEYSRRTPFLRSRPRSGGDPGDSSYSGQEASVVLSFFPRNEFFDSFPIIFWIKETVHTIV